MFESTVNVALCERVVESEWQNSATIKEIAIHIEFFRYVLKSLFPSKNILTIVAIRK